MMVSACARCSHPEAEHTRTTGPNSIGQFWHRQCRHGWVNVGGYHLIERFDSCACPKFEPSKLRWWLKTARAELRDWLREVFR